MYRYRIRIKTWSITIETVVYADTLTEALKPFEDELEQGGSLRIQRTTAGREALEPALESGVKPLAVLTQPFN